MGADILKVPRGPVAQPRFETFLQFLFQTFDGMKIQADVHKRPDVITRIGESGQPPHDFGKS